MMNSCIVLKKRLMAVVSAAVMLSVAMASFAMPAHAEEAEESPGMVLAEDVQQTLQKGDILLLGTPDEELGYDGMWRVLDPTQTNTQEPGILLLLENLVGPDDETGLRFLITEDEGTDVAAFLAGGKDAASENQTENETLDTAYQHSDLKIWLAEFEQNHLTAAEQAAVIPITKSDDAYTHIQDMGSVLGEQGANMQGKVPFDASENILDGDRLFPLSVEEADSADYGLDTDAGRIATYKGEAAHWWTRSPHAPDFPNDVGFVFWKGWLLDFPVNNARVANINAYARPAMNIDPEQFAFMMKDSTLERTFAGVEEGAEETTTESTVWKVYWKDASLDGIQTLLEDRQEDVITLTYSNAPVREGAQISAAVTDAEGNLVWYSPLQEANQAEGTLVIDLTGKLAEKSSLMLCVEASDEQALSGAASAFHTVDLTAVPQTVIRAQEAARQQQRMIAIGVTAAAVVILVVIVAIVLRRRKNK